LATSSLIVLWVTEALPVGAAIRLWRRGEVGRFDDMMVAVVTVGIVVLGLSLAAIATVELRLRRDRLLLADGGGGGGA